MKPANLGALAAFLSGVAVALLASYPVPRHSIYLCFVAVFFGMGACIVAASAIVVACTHRERVRAERVIDLTVDRMLERRGLELVEDG